MSNDQLYRPLPPEEETAFPPPLEKMATDMVQALIQLAWDTGYKWHAAEQRWGEGNLTEYARAAVEFEDLKQQRDVLRTMIERVVLGDRGFAEQVIRAWWMEHKGNQYGAGQE